MTDLTQIPPPSRRSRHASQAEFRVYFAAIFVLALPAATAKWTRAALTGDKAGMRRGVLARAYKEAATITPLIFSV